MLQQSDPAGSSDACRLDEEMDRTRCSTRMPRSRRGDAIMDHVRMSPQSGPCSITRWMAGNWGRVLAFALVLLSVSAAAAATGLPMAVEDHNLVGSRDALLDDHRHGMIPESPSQSQFIMAFKGVARRLGVAEESNPTVSYDAKLEIFVCHTSPVDGTGDAGLVEVAEVANALVKDPELGQVRCHAAHDRNRGKWVPPPVAWEPCSRLRGTHVLFPFKQRGQLLSLAMTSQVLN